MRMKTLLTSIVALGAFISAAQPLHAAQSAADALVQSPKLGQPSRGSVAGNVANLSVGASDLVRGAFSLVTPISAPTERGPLLANFLPTYTPDGGLSEWGMGWGSRLSMRLTRAVGTLDFATDDVASPWGTLTAGNDGYFYPHGVSALVRAKRTKDDWVVVTSDGTRFTFLAADAVATPRGVYEWNLSEVVSVVGDRTQIHYVANSSGRRFVSDIVYGGRGIDFQHRIRLDYEAVAVSTSDYHAGIPITLDRRVVKVTAESRDAATGLLAERWHHDLRYVQSPAGIAFLLSDVQRVFASGDSEPPLHYDYSFPEDALASATLAPLPDLDAYLSKAGPDGFQPTRVSFVDVEEDGRIDLEQVNTFALLHHTDAGWASESLPTVPNPNTMCRPQTGSVPRTLARMIPSATEPQVLVLSPVGANTNFTVCSRSGTTLGTGSVADRWSLGSNVRLVDLDHDLRPDLVKVSRGQYQVLLNTSKTGAYAFSPVKSGTLLPAFDPTTSWVHDMNGDGLPDLIARYAKGIVVWHGNGAGGFETQGTSSTFVAADGAALTDLSPFQITFTDANKDGIADTLLSRGRYLYLFTNRGDHFQEIAIPGFAQINWDVGLPVAADLGGIGEEQVVMVTGGKAVAFTLSRPESGLLVGASDGKGGRARFEYRRAQPSPGIFARQPMLTRLVVDATGTDTIDSQYDYDQPVFDSRGQFLIGFKNVRKTNLTTVESITFQVDDDVQVATESLFYDPRVHDAYKRSFVDYEESTFGGVRWVRMKRQGSAFVGPTSTASGDTNEILAYDNGCPSQRRTTSSAGTVTVTTTRADLPVLGDALHCIASREHTQATHPAAPARDVAFDTIIDRTAEGLATNIHVESGGAALQLEAVDYDPLHRVTGIRRPGKGNVQVAYDSLGRVATVLREDGVPTSASYGTLRDEVVSMSEDHGDGAAWAQSFRVDTLERFFRQWDNLGTGSESNPALELSYVFADPAHPARIVSRMLSDGASQVHRTVAELQTASGEAIAKASLAPEGWIFGPITELERSTATSVIHNHSPIAAEGIGLASATDLFSEGKPVAQIVRSSVGPTLSDDRTIQGAVTKHTQTTMTVDAGLVSSTTSENGVFTEMLSADGQGRVVARTDATSHVTHETYDALGRLVEVVLPNGSDARVTFDPFGRPSVIERVGLGRIELAYAADSGLLASRTFRDARATMIRRVRFDHDALGRVVRETHEDAAGASRVYAYTFDGGAGDTHVLGQRGFLSSVEGPSSKVDTLRRADGKILRQTETIPGWISVSRETDYFDDGTPRSVTRIVRDAAGAELERSTQATTLDAYGRVQHITLNGAPFLDYEYDGLGRISRVALPGGESYLPTYDAVTQAQTGFNRVGTGWTLGMNSELDARGLVAAERIDYASGAAAQTSRDRTYTYDARKVLTGTGMASGALSYVSDPSGNLTRITDIAGTRNITRTATRIVAGSVTYTLDTFGRVIQKGDLKLSYGPDSQVASASRGATTWTFGYGADGKRVVKDTNGSHTAGYFTAGYFDLNGFVEPVKIGTQLVGVIRGGTFVSLASDTRGTLLAGTGGGYVEVTPYGKRNAHPDLANAIDYAGKGYDADLDVIRMGIRDYDPTLAQFTTPDPVFFEDLAKCAESALQCNLYGYAGGDPIRYVDPTGGERKDSVVFIKSHDMEKPDVLVTPPNTDFTWNTRADLSKEKLGGMLEDRGEKVHADFSLKVRTNADGSYIRGGTVTNVTNEFGPLSFAGTPTASSGQLDSHTVGATVGLQADQTRLEGAIPTGVSTSTYNDGEGVSATKELQVVIAPAGFVNALHDGFVIRDRIVSQVEMAHAFSVAAPNSWLNN